MNRYYLYLILIHMLTNIVAYVPRILLSERLAGGIWSLLAALPIGMLFLYIFHTAMARFPGQTYPQILKRHVPKWLTVFYILFNCGMWFIAGFLILQGFIRISERFIDPEINPIYMTAMFLLVICYGALMKSDRLLYILELVVVLSLPLMLFIFLKAYRNEYMQWDAVLEALSHYKAMPSWDGIAAASYTFMGLSSIAVFNRLLQGRISWKYWLLIGGVGLINLFTSVYIPIGVNGIEGIQDYVYPWLMTADTLRMEYGFIERALFVFILMYLGLSLVHIAMLWHVAIEMGKEVLGEKTLKWRNVRLVPLLFILFFCSATLLGVAWMNEYTTYGFARLWLRSLLPINALAAATLIWIVWREKKWRRTKTSS